MQEDNALLSPECSPSTLKAAGVRRVNSLPVVMAAGVILLFALIIAMVAVKRAQAQQRVEAPEPYKASSASTRSTARMADEVIHGRSGGMIEAVKPVAVQETPVLEVPVALIDNPDVPPVPSVPDDGSELERIRQEKVRFFEEAVRAKTGIEASFSASTSTNANTAQNPALSPSDTTAAFQEQLQMVRAAMNGKESVALGGVEDAKRWELHSETQAPQTPYELKTGAVIPGVMISGIKSELPGQIIAQVSQHVFDTATGRFLLIPQGTRLLGVYSSEVAYGQSTVLIAWQRLIFPDGKTLDIGSMPGTDSAGYTGFHDKVNNHYARTFGSALLMSGIVAGVSLSQNQNDNGPFAQPNAQSVMSQALGQQLGEVTAQMIGKNLNIAPTLEIRPGYRFNIMVTKDLVFEKPWKPFDYRFRSAS
ncbi:conjugal transfer protein trbI [Legionella geestiana]|uniref:Conjugal transfer protein trbI n=1 Tax=Legionella geestiana TaxID=45065 RepID=A0A0W0U7T5_9GAMM|nr:TrbI/VirB10 family protein [Legionella geestiana]KTD03687.1 conjugal transfer protein trbI [Legionella geestiana]QBS11539.1 conjugal transfer protein TrbI [Legionella geestiana]STX53789.1 putative conjugal transfer protein trbI [Legionella geestiana]